MSRPIVLIPGDGIGPEVVAAARMAIDATGVDIDWVTRQAGGDARAGGGASVPEDTVEAIVACGVALKGPTTSGGGGTGPRSANVELRRRLALEVGIRPVRSFTGSRRARPGVALTTVRTNGDDLYAGLGFDADTAEAQKLRALLGDAGLAPPDADAGLSVRAIAPVKAEAAARAAFDWARRHSSRARVTAIHKGTVVPHTDGLFLDVARRVAGEHQDVEFDDVLVDTACYELVRRPEEYSVLLTSTMYGDIVSDLAAGLTGGLGLAPTANLGSDCAMFEAVHGSAPRLAGRGVANPMAVMLAGAMLLRHIGEAVAADRLEDAVADVIEEGRTLTYDLAEPGEGVSTSEVASAVVARLAG